jgi:restriction system protein
LSWTPQFSEVRGETPDSVREAGQGDLANAKLRPLGGIFASGRSKAAALFRSIVLKHLDELARAQIHGVKKCRYGEISIEEWNREANYFFKNIAIPEMKKFKPGDIKTALDREIGWFNEVVNRRVVELNSEYSSNMTPLQYESYCASLLSRTGWDARTTRASGDQGVDVIATRRGVRLVLQCKLYSTPVGNAAVQEAAAAKLHERADMGGVVTNFTFTPAAKTLAQTTGTLLLHHSQLASL